MLAALGTIACLIGITIYLLAGLARDIPDKRDWPPISDDEFMAKCSPGVSRDTALRVRKIVSEQLGVDYERVHPDQEFVRDLGCD